MNKALRLLLCLFFAAVLLTALSLAPSYRVIAQMSTGPFIRINTDRINIGRMNTGRVNIDRMNEPEIKTDKFGYPSRIVSVPDVITRDFSSLVLPMLGGDYIPPPLIFTNQTGAMLYSAISKRLGVRYRFYGTDDRGYDCSGFVWRVYQDAGADFERVAARTLWNQLPEAIGEETKEFGTLVFFNGLKHVGIVRDAYTFYHASRSRGVIISSFSGYWERRVTGYRRAPTLIPEPSKAGD